MLGTAALAVVGFEPEAAEALFDNILGSCGLNAVLLGDLRVDGDGKVYQHGDDREPWGRITTWGRRLGTARDFQSMSITCRAHGGSCRRVFSKHQLELYNLGDGRQELLEWLLLAVNGRVSSQAAHCALPKPLPEAMKGSGDALDGAGW